jgi:hypothetical protein
LTRIAPPSIVAAVKAHPEQSHSDPIDGVVVRLTIAGNRGFTLAVAPTDESDRRAWAPLFDGHHVLAFGSRDALRGFLESAVPDHLSPADLRSFLSHPDYFDDLGDVEADIDTAVGWLTAPRITSLNELSAVCEAMNFADDVAITAGISEAAWFAASRRRSLGRALDLLTLATTFIGEGTPVHDDQAELVRQLPRGAGTAARRVSKLVAPAVRFM